MRVALKLRSLHLPPLRLYRLAVFPIKPTALSISVTISAGCGLGVEARRARKDRHAPEKIAALTDGTTMPPNWRAKRNIERDAEDSGKSQRNKTRLCLIIIDKTSLPQRAPVPTSGLRTLCLHHARQRSARYAQSVPRARPRTARYARYARYRYLRVLASYK